MKILLILALTTVTFGSYVNAQTKKDGSPDMRFKANREVYSPSSSTPTYPVPQYKTSTTTSSFTIRPAYPGAAHTESHGGTYVGETNSHHKDGTYVNPNSNPVGSNVYGTHKSTSKLKN